MNVELSSFTNSSKELSVGKLLPLATVAESDSALANAMAVAQMKSGMNFNLCSPCRNQRGSGTMNIGYFVLKRSRAVTKRIFARMLIEC